MPVQLEIQDFLSLPGELPVIDVRSPGEFRQGHIPEAVNIPLFDDEERAVVGTIYKNSGSETAIRKGLEIALPKAEGYIRACNDIAGGQREVRVHCWRGGMRSENMAKLFESAGFTAYLLTGGYKAYRRFVRTSLTGGAKIAVIGGFTGSGKTEILNAVAVRGEQVIDLERLANHKGSVFGALGQLPQPTNEQFENDLYQIWRGFDLSRPVWMEDESRMIGLVTLPDPVFEKIQSGILIRVDTPRDERLERLVRDYAGFDPSQLKEALVRIGERLGGTRLREATEAINGGNFTLAAGIALDYYDKAYNHSISRRKSPLVYPYTFIQGDPGKAADEIIRFAYQHL